MSYVKKTTGGGQIDPPPAGIGLKLLFAFISNINTLTTLLVVEHLYCGVEEARGNKEGKKLKKSVIKDIKKI